MRKSYHVLLNSFLERHDEQKRENYLILYLNIVVAAIRYLVYFE